MIMLIFAFEFVNTSFMVKKIRPYGVLRKITNNFLYVIKNFLENVIIRKRAESGPVIVINIFMVIFSSIMIFIYSIMDMSHKLPFEGLVTLISINVFGIITSLRNEKIDEDNDAKTLVSLSFLALVILILISSEIFQITNPGLNTIVSITSMILIFKITFMWINCEINKSKEWHNQILTNVFILSIFIGIGDYFVSKTNITILYNLKIELYALAIISYYVLKVSLIQSSVNKVEYMLKNVLHRYIGYTLVITAARIILWKL
jgi:hypothetical protein